MGIPGFITWFKKSACPHAFTQRPPRQTFDHVYVDLATILHKALNRANNTNQLHRGIYRDLENILSSCQPRKTLMLALDGPAPLAKLITQRSRRTSAGKKEIRLGLSGPSGLGLTPGTPLMMELERSLDFFVAKQLSQRWPNLLIEVSGATVPGEGELKILHRMRNPLKPITNYESHAIVGADSDLYLMAFLQPRLSNVWILPDASRARPMRSKRESTKEFSLEALNQAFSHLQFVNSTASAKEASRRLEGAKADLAFIAILCSGNDYLPPLFGPSLEQGGEKSKGLWADYLALRKKKQWEDRTLLCQNGGKYRIDTEMLVKLLSPYDTVTSKHRERDGWQMRKPKPSAEHYLKGLQWVIDMYTYGICPDYQYVYDAQIPLASELLAYLRKNSKPTKAKSEAEKGPFSAAVCSMALLPPIGGPIHALPALRPLMEPSSPIGDLYRVCPTCQDISANLRTAQLDLEVQSRKRNRANFENYQTGDTSGPESNSGNSSGSELSETESEETWESENSPSDIQKLKIMLRSLESRRLKHHNEVHPYHPFPVHRIVEAVSKIPLENFSSEEQKILKFGQSTAYWRVGRPSALYGQKVLPFIPTNPLTNDSLPRTEGLKQMKIEETTIPKTKSSKAKSPQSNPSTSDSAPQNSTPNSEEDSNLVRPNPPIIARRRRVKRESFASVVHKTGQIRPNGRQIVQTNAYPLGSMLQDLSRIHVSQAQRQQCAGYLTNFPSRPASFRLRAFHSRHSLCSSSPHRMSIRNRRIEQSPTLIPMHAGLRHTGLHSASNFTRAQHIFSVCSKSFFSKRILFV